MSSTIAKSIRSCKGEDGKWHITGVFAESNVYPRTFEKFTSPKGYDTREVADGYILKDYYSGCLKGNTRYLTFLKECQSGLFKCREYDRFVKLYDLKWHGIDRKHGNAFAKDAYERIGAIHDRLERWICEVAVKLARVYAAEWKPCAERYAVVFSGNYVVTSGGEARCKYRYMYEHDRDWTEYAKRFTKLNAMEMLKHYAKMDAKMVLLP